MDYSKEVEKVMLECKNKGINSREVLQLMEVPCEWTGDSYLFDFSSMAVEELSDYIDYILRKRGYILDKGTPVDGFYRTSRLVNNPYYHNNTMNVECRYKVEIYPRGGKTYLEIIMPYQKVSKIETILFKKTKEISFDSKLIELDEIVDQIKFLKPSIKGYLVCNKCGAYYEVKKDEFHDSFDKNCECGGTFEYIASPKQPDKKLAERKQTAGPTEYLRAPAALLLMSSACFLGGASHNSNVLTLLVGFFGLIFGFSFALMRYRCQELLLDMIYRRLIYFLAAVLFFVGSLGLIAVLIQIDNYSETMVELSFFTVLAIMYGLSMTFKLINPDDPRNFLDPPL